MSGSVKIGLQLLFVAFLLITSNYAKAKSRVYFTPSADCENNIIKLIGEAKEAIDVAVYAINNRKIVEALKRAKQHKIKIRILTDRLQASNKYSLVRELYENDFDLQVHNKYKIQHNKFAVFDKKKVVTGSFNWTESASKKNSENCLFVDDDELIADKYGENFEKLWMLNNKQKSEDWLRKRSRLKGDEVKY